MVRALFGHSRLDRVYQTARLVVPPPGSNFQLWSTLQKLSWILTAFEGSTIPSCLPLHQIVKKKCMQRRKDLYQQSMSTTCIGIFICYSRSPLQTSSDSPMLRLQLFWDLKHASISRTKRLKRVISRLRDSQIPWIYKLLSPRKLALYVRLYILPFLQFLLFGNFLWLTHPTSSSWDHGCLNFPSLPEASNSDL